jgi:hypothetical protein
LNESRANEIRMRLIEWQEIPEGIRQSLRQLAAELGTSHQLLSFYLRRLHQWKSAEHHRRADAIGERAEAEGRLMTNHELYLEQANRQEASRCYAASMVDWIERKFEAQARRGNLPLEFVNGLAKRLNDPWVAKLQNILRKQEERQGKRLSAILRQLNQAQDTDEYQRIYKKLPLQYRKNLGVLGIAGKPAIQKKSRSNLPSKPVGSRKPFELAKWPPGNSAKTTNARRLRTGKKQA